MPSTWPHARIIQPRNDFTYPEDRRSLPVSLQRIPMGGGGEKSYPTPVHVQRPFGGEVNKLGEKIVVGRNVWNILFFRESSSPAHDWSVTFGCNVWRIRIDLFFLPSKLNLPIFRFYCDCTIHEFDRNRKKKYNDGRFFFEGIDDCRNIIKYCNV